MKPRQMSPEDYLALKTAFRLLVQRVGGLVAAETVTRVRVSHLADYYHPQKPDSFPPADVVADLEAVAGQPLVTATLARLSGHHLVAWDPPAEGCEARAVAAVLKGAGALATTFAEAMEDGRLSATERDALATGLAEIGRATEAALAMLRRRAAEAAAA